MFVCFHAPQRTCEGRSQFELFQMTWFLALLDADTFRAYAFTVIPSAYTLCIVVALPIPFKWSVYAHRVFWCRYISCKHVLTCVIWHWVLALASTYTFWIKVLQFLLRWPAHTVFLKRMLFVYTRPHAWCSHDLWKDINVRQTFSTFEIKPMH